MRNIRIESVCISDPFQENIFPYKVDGQTIVSNEARAYENLITGRECCFRVNRFTVERKLNEVGVFFHEMSTCQKRLNSLEEMSINRSTKFFRQFKIPIEAGINDRSPISSLQPQLNKGNTLFADSPPDHLRPPFLR